MEIKQNPFSVYDFLGYFVPGAIFFFGIVYAPIFQFDFGFDFTALSDCAKRMEAGFFLPFTLVAYNTGHFLSFLSSITIEKYSVWKVGYPSSFLFGEKAKNYFLDLEKKTIIENFWRLVVWLFLLPISIPDYLLVFLSSNEPHYSRPLSEPQQQISRKALVSFPQGREFSANLKSLPTDLFIIAYHFAVEHAPAHLPKMQNYVALYGFTRTTAMLFVIWFWFGILTSIRTATLPLLAMFLMVGLCFMAYLNFMKFYRRFSMEVFMAMIAITTFPIDEKHKTDHGL